MTRRLAGLLLAAVILASSAGCVQLPHPVTGSSRTLPALTVEQANVVLARAHTVMTTANRTRSAAKAATVLSGFALDKSEATYAMYSVTGEKLSTWFGPMRAVQVASGPAGRYPQSAWVTATATAKRDKGRSEVLVLGRADAGADWRVSYLIPVKTKRLPVLAEVDGLALDDPTDVETNGLKPAAAGDLLTRALTSPHGKAARRFSPDRYGEEYRDWVDGWKSKHLKVSALFGTRAGFAAARTADGGVLVMTSGILTITEVSTDGWYTYFSRGPMKRKFPGKYRSMTTSYLSGYLIRVPPHGGYELLPTIISDCAFSAVVDPEA